MQPPSAAIVTNGLTRRFGSLIAVDGLTLAVQRGEVFGFLGHNGAGKTTTIRLLNGVLTPTSGTATVLGFDPLSEGSLLRAHTGVLTEVPSLDERLSARENLTLYADLYGVPEGQVEHRVESMLELLDLETRDNERVGGYSKGMKQRLALARALIHEPEVVFLDEPTSALDPVAARHVRDLIRQMGRQERTVVVCTHNLPEAQRLCDRVAVLEEGRILAMGSPAELSQQIGAMVQRVEIEVANHGVQKALDVVRGLPGVHDAAARADTVTVQGAGRDSIPGLISALTANDVPIYRVSPREPSLEDVYFALHGVSPVDIA